MEEKELEQISILFVWLMMLIIMSFVFGIPIAAIPYVILLLLDMYRYYLLRKAHMKKYEGYKGVNIERDNNANH